MGDRALWTFVNSFAEPMKVWPETLGVVALGLVLIAGVAHATDANLRLVQTPPPPRREFDPGELRPYDSPRCRQAKEDVKVLDGRLNGPEFASIPSEEEYNLGCGWERPGGGIMPRSSGQTERERVRET